MLGVAENAMNALNELERTVENQSKSAVRNFKKKATHAEAQRESPVVGYYTAQQKLARLSSHHFVIQTNSAQLRSEQSTTIISSSTSSAITSGTIPIGTTPSGTIASATARKHRTSSHYCRSFKYLLDRPLRDGP